MGPKLSVSLRVDLDRDDGEGRAMNDSVARESGTFILARRQISRARIVSNYFFRKRSSRTTSAPSPALSGSLAGSLAGSSLASVLLSAAAGAGTGRAEA